MSHGVAAGMISRGDARDQDRDLEVKAREAKIDEHGAASEIEHKSPSGPALRRPLESAEQLGDISPISTALSSTGTIPQLFLFCLITRKYVCFQHICVIDAVCN